MPRPFNQITNPVVVPEGSNPWEDPKIVAPNIGVSRLVIPYWTVNVLLPPFSIFFNYPCCIKYLSSKIIEKSSEIMATSYSNSFKWKDPNFF